MTCALNAPTSSKLARVKMLIGDFSGTTFDKDNVDTISALKDVCDSLGLTVSYDLIIKWIGQSKDSHFWNILQDPSVRQEFMFVHGKKPGLHDAHWMGNVLYPKAVSLRMQKTRVIPGTKSTFEQLLKMGIGIGITTGFPRAVANLVIDRFHQAGISMTSVATVASDDPGIMAGRPLPDMMYLVMNKGGYSHNGRVPMHADVVKVGDTPEDIQEGKNARAWTIAIVEDSALNPIALKSETELNAMTSDDLLRMYLNTAHTLAKHRPDFLVRSIESVPRIIQECINPRLARGDLPNSLNAHGSVTDWTDLNGLFWSLRNASF